MTSFSTTKFPVVYSQQLNFTQDAFIGANYRSGERPILSIGLTIHPVSLEGIIYYIYEIIFNGTIKILVRTTIVPGEPTGGRESQRGDNTSGISVGQIYVSNNFSTGFTSNSIPFTFEITFSGGVPIDKCSYKTEDRYIFSTNGGIFFPTSNPTMNITFIRSDKATEADGCTPNTLSFLNKNDVIVPAIFIDFQSLIDGSDIGNTTFKVIDEFQYYNHKTTPIIPHHKCKIMTSNNPKITNFEKSCPLIVSVLEGIGNTAWEKTRYLFENVVTNINDIYNFFINLVKYSMTRYLLSRIIYGNFNIKYVLNKYNKRFLKDLSNTRFCNFVDLFTDPNSDIFGYEQYFI
jgi:hypothetical protein